MPDSHALIETLDLDVLSVCANYGLTAMEAARRYPAVATKVFALYGEDPMFQSAFERYGQMVVPVVGYFVENGSNRYRVTAAVHEAIQQVSQGRMPTWGETPSGEQMGYMAVQELDQRGAEFEIVDGRAKRKSIEATVQGTKNLFLSGIQKLETVWVRGESPTWKDLRRGRAGRRGPGGWRRPSRERSPRRRSRGRRKFTAFGHRERDHGSPAGRHDRYGPCRRRSGSIRRPHPPDPGRLGRRWTAERLGLNGPLCIFFAYLLLFQFLYSLVRPLLRCIWQPVRLAWRTASRHLSTRDTAPA